MNVQPHCRYHHHSMSSLEPVELSVTSLLGNKSFIIVSVTLVIFVLNNQASLTVKYIIDQVSYRTAPCQHAALLRQAA